MNRDSIVEKKKPLDNESQPAISKPEENIETSKAPEATKLVSSFADNSIKKSIGNADDADQDITLNSTIPFADDDTPESAGQLPSVGVQSTLQRADSADHDSIATDEANTQRSSIINQENQISQIKQNSNSTASRLAPEGNDTQITSNQRSDRSSVRAPEHRQVRLARPQTEKASNPEIQAKQHGNSPATQMSSTAPSQDNFFTKQERTGIVRQQDTSVTKQEILNSQQNNATLASVSDRTVGQDITLSMRRDTVSRTDIEAMLKQQTDRLLRATDGRPKYETYSRSEIENLLKLQADQLLNTLSGKVAAQQRAFQEALASQEKAFTKISDNYLAEFDNSRIKLEQISRSAQDNIHREMDDFHKQMSKELEQHRTQINKVVAPVNKALAESGKAKPQDKPQIKIDASSKGVASAQVANLEKLVKMVLAASIISVILSVACVLSVLDRNNSSNESKSTTNNATGDANSGTIHAERKNSPSDTSSAEGINQAGVKTTAEENDKTGAVTAVARSDKAESTTSTARNDKTESASAVARNDKAGSTTSVARNDKTESASTVARNDKAGSTTSVARSGKASVMTTPALKNKTGTTAPATANQ